MICVLQTQRDGRTSQYQMTSTGQVSATSTKESKAEVSDFARKLMVKMGKAPPAPSPATAIAQAAPAESAPDPPSPTGTAKKFFPSVGVLLRTAVPDAEQLRPSADWLVRGLRPTTIRLSRFVDQSLLKQLLDLRAQIAALPLLRPMLSIAANCSPPPPASERSFLSPPFPWHAHCLLAGPNAPSLFASGLPAFEMAELDAVFSLSAAIPSSTGTFAHIASSNLGASEYLCRKLGSRVRGLAVLLKADSATGPFRSPSVTVEHILPSEVAESKSASEGGAASLSKVQRRVASFSKGVDLLVCTAAETFDDPAFNGACTAALWQSLLGLRCLRAGGSFVCLVGDLFLRSAVGVLWCLSRSFSRVAIARPLTSAPCNGQRYLVCSNFIGTQNAIVSAVSEHLTQALQLNSELRHEEKGRTTVEIVPTTLLLQDPFRFFVIDMANRLVRSELMALRALLRGDEKAESEKASQAPTTAEISRAREALLERLGVANLLKTKD